MSLRTRLALLVAFCVAGAVVAVSVVVYVAAENRMISAVDDTLGGRASFIAGRDFSNSAEGPLRRALPERRAGVLRLQAGIPSVDIFQIVRGDGTVLVAPSDNIAAIPLVGRDLAVARGEARAHVRNATIEGAEYRVYATRGPGDTVVLTARSLEEVNGTLADLRRVLFIVSGAGILAAAVAGFVVAQRSLQPVAQLTQAAEHVAATQDLSHSIHVYRDDEIGRLAASFNTMLHALESSRIQHRQLVTDVNHELRTPLTSLRTNIELLERDPSLPADERRQILADAAFEVGELTKIVGELVDLATDHRFDESPTQELRLDELTRSVVERMRRRKGVTIRLESMPVLVVGHRDLLERAVANLVDNAVKFSDGSIIDVHVETGFITVRDHGPGIARADLPHIFERFFRSPEARGKPGSGLGLAIAKQIAAAHCGDVFAENAEGGGARFTLAIPGIVREPFADTESAPRAFLGTR
jgi:two-component system sensor histidine kinase MprB